MFQTPREKKMKIPSKRLAAQQSKGRFTAPEEGASLAPIPKPWPEDECSPQNDIKSQKEAPLVCSAHP